MDAAADVKEVQVLCSCLLTHLRVQQAWRWVPGACSRFHRWNVPKRALLEDLNFARGHEWEILSRPRVIHAMFPKAQGAEVRALFSQIVNTNDGETVPGRLGLYKERVTMRRRILLDLCLPWLCTLLLGY